MTHPHIERSRRRSEAEWRQILATYAESGLDQRPFCQQQGIGYSTFCQWKKRLSASSPPLATDLLELTPEPGVDSSPWEIELTLSADLVLRVRRR